MKLNYDELNQKFISCKQIQITFRLLDMVYSIEKMPDGSCICFTHLSQYTYPSVNEMIDMHTFCGECIINIWDKVTILELFDFSYNSAMERFVKQHSDFSFSYLQKTYWVTKACGNYYSIGREDGSWQEQFLSPHELFERAKIHGKSLKEIWEDIIVESFQ